jgi:membrane protein DedA with SNARE-associated domain
MMNIDTLLVQYGLLAIFLLLLTKSCGVPVPIPADLILLTAAVGAAQQKFNVGLAFALTVLPLVLGALFQFGVARGPARSLLFRFGRYVGLTPVRLDAASARVKKGGIIGITISMLIPGIRDLCTVASGLAGLPVRRFLPGLVLGTSLFVGVHFILGYLGDSLLSVIGRVLPPTPILILLVVLFLIVFALWAIAFYRQKGARREKGAVVREMWHEGVCPACLALSVVSPLRQLGKEVEQ